MNKTMMDALKEQKELTGHEGYLQVARNAPKVKDNSFWNTVQDYGKTFLKGSIEGITRLGQALGPTTEMPTVEEGKLKFPKSREESLEQQTNVLNEILPTEEGFGQKALRRGLKEAPTMMAFPGGAAQAGTRSLLAGTAGQTAEELGAPEWAQTLSEIGAYLGPDVTKKLMEKGKNKELIQAGKKLGMSDKQITPLIQSEFKQKWLTKLAPKRGSAERALKETKKGLGQSYDILRQSESATANLSAEPTDKMFKHMTKILEDMPASVRDKIFKDAQDLVSKPITGNSLINFYQDVGHAIGPDTKQLANLKVPIQQALSSISPELGKDFSNLNKLYSNYFPIAGRLKPTLTSDLIGAVEAAGLLGSFVFGDPSFIGKFVGEKAARNVAKQMLINPRLQQLGSKMVDAFNSNKWGVAKKVSDLISKELQDESPEVSEIIKDLSEEEIKSLFKYHGKQTT